MKLSEKIKELDFKGRDFPIIAGTVKFKLHNVHNGKDEVVEEHNMATNALANIFTNNYGGLVNYQNFADLYNTWLGGVLLFQNQLDLTSADNYGIPDRVTNPVKAHAGQTMFSDQADDLTRGNPDNTGTVLSVNSTKLRWEWGTSAGNGTIASLGLTHSDVGSYGAGVASQAQKSLVPFVDIGAVSRSYSYGDNANAILGIDGNVAYNFYLVDSTTVHIYKTPINNTKFKLQGGATLPITAYSQMITATLPNSYNKGNGDGDCYYWFDFANNKLILFGVPSAMGSTLYRDDINLTDGTVTHQTITVTGASLYKFKIKPERWQPSASGYTMAVPAKAIIFDNYLYVYGCSTYQNVADLMYKINLNDTTDITEVDTTDFDIFTAQDYSASWSRTNGRCTVLGGLIVQNSFIVNGDKVFQTSPHNAGLSVSYIYPFSDKISSPLCGANVSTSTVSACKLYLATKFNLPSAVTKTSAQSMTVEYTLTEV